MAKYDVTFSCGHNATVELFGKMKDRERKIEYFENSGICPECYKKEQREIEKQRGLILVVSIDPYSVKYPVILHYEGDSYTYKDQIKATGYYWQETPSTGILGIFDFPKKSWNKRIPLDDLENELKKAESINAKIENKITEIDLAAYAQIVKQKKQKEAVKAEKLKEIQKPVCPSVLVGNKWNGTIYGKKGSYCFYGNGQKISITDQQKADIEKYLKEKETYKKAVAEIENSL